MTENEAKEWIKYLGNKNLPYDRSPKSRKLACDIAIQALEKVQQFEAIGTVEEIQKKMEELDRWHTDRINENIKNPFAYTSTMICHNCDHKDEYIEELEAENAEYKSIGTIEEFKALKEKNEPKKPIIHGLGQRYCSVCKCGGADHFYCARCGQKLG